MKLDPPGWEEWWEGETLTYWPPPFPSLHARKVQNSWGSTVTIWKPLVFFIHIGHFVLFKFMLHYQLSFTYLQNFCVHVLFHQQGKKLLNS